MQIGFNLFDRIVAQMPGLKLKLLQAGMFDEPVGFVRKSGMTALYMGIAVMFVLFVIFDKLGITLIPLFILLPVVILLLFAFFLRAPDVIILKRQKGISKEIVFAGRFIIIELESGVPLYKTFINVARSYDIIGIYFKEIIDNVNIGTSMEDALGEAAENVPSPDLRKIFWQILNSMRTGTDVTNSLNSVIDQITREQQIMVKEYGRKLNPLAMFYMMTAVILPSLGMVLVMILSTFMGLQLPLSILLILTAGLGFIQLMFVNMIKSSRPPVEL